ncbi:hypothetical protein [Streptomyces poonensis]|uniref:Uncharacterized protein n=1 Tax=Streptomyces poonensis TaxID=68255 RepID=A0A918Q0L7_9ACTN|nr:hypothetical protein [Streptomyces poonensis]GGZ29593.1 hypothetical protein GCM10010365_57440 [Streptomyces poonensis]
MSAVPSPLIPPPITATRATDLPFASCCGRKDGRLSAATAGCWTHATASGADRIAIKDALDTIAEILIAHLREEILTAHLREDAFETD